MKTKRTTLLTLLALTSLLLAFGYRDVLTSLLKTLSEYNRIYPEEKIYLHVDKTLYNPGDDIWFSLYTLNGVTHLPSAISQVAYVDLIDPKGTTVSTADVYAQDGAGSGDFRLSDEAPGGIYRLRAYTTWTSNFPSQAVFEKQIQVQRVITPRLLLKLDWQREAYGPGETASARLTVRTLQDEKARNAVVAYSVRLAGKSVLQDTVWTDADGAATVSFPIAGEVTTSDGILSATVRHKGSVESISRSVPIVLNQINLAFFPEGGDLVNGLESRVAFKATNEFGKAADVSGEIVSENQIVATFDSYHMGMGAFTFIPEHGKSYEARLTKPRSRSSFPLPAQRRTDFVLRVKEVTDDGISLTVSSALSSRRNAFLVATNHGRAIFDSALHVAPGSNDLRIPLDKDPLLSGVVVVTLFDERVNAMAERLVFVRRDNDLRISLVPDKTSYAPGDEVNLQIQTANRLGEPQSARLSIAVVDDQLISFADDKQDNILSWFMLSSEVRGKIEKPAFYFDQEEPRSAAALDYLLMTQGWRRFQWEKLDAPVTNGKMPEKPGTISGFIQLSRSGLRMAGEVTLIEMGHERRVKRLVTRADGSFDFLEVDPTVPSLLLARRPYSVVSTQKRLQSSTHGLAANVAPATDRDEAFGTRRLVIDNSMRWQEGDAMDTIFSMSSDVQYLTETVVTGYAVEERRHLTGSVVVPSTPFLVSGVEQALMGRLPGISIYQQRAMIGAGPLSIPGSSSMSGGTQEPMWVIDGVPLDAAINRNFPNSTMVGSDQIDNIHVWRSAEVPMNYGVRSNNGVVSVSTRNWRQPNLAYWPRRSHYNYVIVPARTFTIARQFYRESTKDAAVRDDFRSTVYWNQHVVTDRDGKATVRFRNNDNTSVFRITAEGMSSKGLIGRKEITYHTRLPFSLDAKLPEFMGYADTLKIPVHITNNTNGVLSTVVTVDAPDELQIAGKKIEVQLKPALTTPVYVTVASTGVSGKFPVTIRATGGTFSDDVEAMLEVHPVGFPVKRVWSSDDSVMRIDLNLHDVEKGSLSGTFKAYPNLMGNLFDNAQQLLSEPHGCFEQVSSSTFPNILVLQYLRRLKKSDPATERKALDYIAKGYGMLKAFEIRGGGFEWFGEPAAHEALSAFGLVEFYEMQKVYDLVDPNLIERTAEWLLRRRDGKGGFRQNRGKYGFSGAPEEVNNAYIVYALSVAGQRGFDVEFNYALNEAKASADMYRKALVANAAWNLGNYETYRALVDEFRQFAAAHDLDAVHAAASITYSYGAALKNETIGFWAQALAKERWKYFSEMDRCIKYLLRHRSYPGFGSTQTTTVCLQALCDFTELAQANGHVGEISIAVNDKTVEQGRYNESDVDPIVLSSFVQSIAPAGRQPIDVRFGSSGLPWQLELNWYSEKPDDCHYTSLDIHTTLAKEARVNETVRLAVSINNNSTSGLPMTMAVIGIPAGLSVQPWQLKELQEKGAFDFYELDGDRLALYYREVGPAATLKINFDLKADTPGTFKGAASCTYLYYNTGCKKWTDGLSIKVKL